MSAEYSFWGRHVVYPPPIEKNEFGFYEPKAMKPSTYDSLDALLEAIDRSSSDIVYISDKGDGLFRLYGTVETENNQLLDTLRKGLKKSLPEPIFFSIFGIIYLASVDNWQIDGRSLGVLMMLVYGLSPLFYKLLDLWDLKVSYKKPLADRVESLWFDHWLSQADFKHIWILPAMLAFCFVLQFGGQMTPAIEMFGLVKPLTDSSEYYRLVTVAFVHGGLIHIGFNAVALYSVTSTFLKFATYPWFFFVFIISVISGSLLSIVMYPETTSVGASGGILGIIGFLMALGIKHQKYLPKSFTKGYTKWLIIIAPIGIIGMEMIDNGAHLGGALMGALIGLLYKEAFLIERINQVSSKEKKQLGMLFKEALEKNESEEEDQPLPYM